MHFIFPPDIITILITFTIVITINITVIIIAMITIITMITVQSPPDVISLGLCQGDFNCCSLAAGLGGNEEFERKFERK